MFLKKDQCDFWEIVQLATQGKRPSMEDSGVYLTPFTSETSLFLSVYDGHAGHRCSNFLANTLPNELRRETQSNGATIPTEDIFCRVFSDTDQLWLESAKDARIEDGSTALCLALDGNDLTVANCGDCRAIFCQNGLTQQLTRDHRPTDEAEGERIVLSGATVIGGRLLGQLGVSRAFGNLDFKDSNLLSSDPEIHHLTLTSEVEILVVGSDGLYDHFSNEEIISFIKAGLITSSLENVVKALVDEAIDRGSEDNITIIVVKFEKAYKKLLKKRAKKQAGKSPTLLSGKSSPLRTSSKNLKHSPDTPQAETSKSSGLFKEVKKGLTLKATVKTSASPVHHSLIETVPHKKKPDPKKTKTIYEEEKWTIFSKPFKHDFFGRTAVTISG